MNRVDAKVYNAEDYKGIINWPGRVIVSSNAKKTGLVIEVDHGSDAIN